MTTTKDLFAPELRGPTIAILMTVALSAFEGLAVAAALPEVAADLGDVDLLPWVITAYLLFSGVATIAAGALVDRLGVSSVFRVAVSLFIVGGVAAGLGPTMAFVVAARIVHGIGAGAINAVGLSAVGLVFPGPLVGRAFAANTTVWGAMSVAGPAIAALMLSVASWRWIFLINLPLGLAALAAGWRTLPTQPPEPDDPGATSVRLDPIVLASLVIVMFGILYAIDSLDVTSIPALLVAVGVGWILLRRERGRPGALIAPRHIIDTPLGPLAWAMALLLVGSIGVSTFIPLYVSGARGVGTAGTAWSVIFFTLGWTAGANVSSRLMDRRSTLSVIRLGAWLVPVGLAGVAAGTWFEAPLWAILSAAVVAGMGVGAATNSALTALREYSPPTEVGRSMAAHQFVRNFGFALGNALFGAVILFVVARSTGDVEFVREAIGGTGDVSGIEAASAIGRGFSLAAIIGAVLAAAAVIPITTLIRRRRTRLAAEAE